LPAGFLSGWLYTDEKRLPEGHVPEQLFHNCSCASVGVLKWYPEINLSAAGIQEYTSRKAHLAAWHVTCLMFPEIKSATVQAAC